ncbi:MAG: thioredoxin [Deltaproteobacteria bacterium]|jgi:thioredoxin 1|nr:thioredoxin [Deltaproteobacteria bacterium]
MAGEFVEYLNDDNFATTIEESEVPVLVDFFATWCGPCTAMAPVLEEFAREQQGKVKVFKINVDENPRTPAKYGVRGIPTLILFSKGKEVDKLVGMAPKEHLETMLAKA